MAFHEEAFDGAVEIIFFWDNGLCLKDLLHDTAICRTADKQHSKTHPTQIS
jgi:hypothetical protein